MAKFNFDNREYDTDKISDQAKNTLGALQFVDAEIQRLQGRIAAMQTARMVYANGLKQELEKGTQTAAPKIDISNDTIKFS